MLSKNLIKIIVPSCLFCLGVSFAVGKYYYKKGNEEGYTEGFRQFETNLIEKHRNITDEKHDILIDEDKFINAVNMIEKGNTVAFENEVYKIHEKIIEEVGATLEISEEERNKLKENLKASNKDLAQEYIEEYVNSIKELKITEIENKTLSFVNTTKVEKATSAMSSHICAFSTMIFSPLKIHLSATQDYAAGFLLDDPCSMLLSGFLNPLSEKLINAGVIKDLEINKSKVKQSYSKMIAELATAEVAYNTQKTNRKGSSFFGGLINSSGTITYQFNCVVKAGFDLSANMEITFNHNAKIVDIAIPQPKIFEPTINTKIIEFDDQDMIKDLDLSDLNVPLNQISQECINFSDQGGIKAKAVKNAKFILMNMFSPLTNLGKGYRLNIHVKN